MSQPEGRTEAGGSSGNLLRPTKGKGPAAGRFPWGPFEAYSFVSGVCVGSGVFKDFPRVPRRHMT